MAAGRDQQHVAEVVDGLAAEVHPAPLRRDDLARRVTAHAVAQPAHVRAAAPGALVGLELDLAVGALGREQRVAVVVGLGDR